eukprot:RCo042704
MERWPTPPSSLGGSPGPSSELTNPLDAKWPSSLSLPVSPNQSSNQIALRRPSGPPSMVVVVSNIQLTFDPKALPTLENRTPLFATVELSPSSAPTPSRPQHITAEIRPVIIAPNAAAVSWYQCWGLAVAGNTGTEGSLVVIVGHRTVAKKRVLWRHQTECLCRAVIPLAALPLNEASTQRVALPFGGALSVVLQLSTVSGAAATAPLTRSAPLFAPGARRVGRWVGALCRRLAGEVSEFSRGSSVVPVAACTTSNRSHPCTR